MLQVAINATEFIEKKVVLFSVVVLLIDILAA